MSAALELTAEFREGAAAAAAGADRSSCPHIWSSNAAEAWHAAHAWHARGYSCEAIERCTNGRGYTVNLRSSSGRLVVAAVDWDVPGDVPAVAFPAIATDSTLAELRAAAPLRSKGKPVEDAGHLPLFVAANEPSLF